MYYLRNYVYEDWEQEARIALYQALKTYENNKGVSFGSYYKSIISNQIYSLLRKQNALKRRDQKDELSIDQKVETEGPDFLAEITTQEPLAMQRLLLNEAIEDCEIKFSKRKQKYFIIICKEPISRGWQRNFQWMSNKSRVRIAV